MRKYNIFRADGELIDSYDNREKALEAIELHESLDRLNDRFIEDSYAVVEMKKNRNFFNK